MKVISFDIWDTIIKRKCHPEEIKLYTARYMLLKYESKIKEKYKNIYEILKKRNQIEADICDENLKNGYDNECRILDVFKMLQKEIFKENENCISKELLIEEIKREKEMVYINPQIMPIFKQYKDLKMYCISDFYMSEESLKEILGSLNLPIHIEKVYSSADYLLNKRTGNLYKKFQKDMNLKSEDHIHVGDNEYSDINMAKSLGIETIKIEKENTCFVPEDSRKFEFNLETIFKKSITRENKLFNIGVKISPLLYFFGYSIVEYAIKNNINKVYYCTREGETFIKAHELILKENPFGVHIPECEILEVSRMATFSASLREVSIHELMRLWSQYRLQSMKSLFKTLAIDINPYKQYMGKYDINISENIMEPWFNLNVQKLFADKEFTSKLNIELKRKRNELLEYFEKKKGIQDDDEPLFVVDIGWRGTIQDNLAYIFANKKIEGYYLTLYDFYNLQPENTYKKQFIKDKNVIDNEISSIITLLEWLFNPSTGSVIEYKDGEAIRKVKKKESEIAKSSVAYIQQGMFEGIKIINDYLKIHPYIAEEFDNYIIDVIKNIKNKPDKELVEEYYNIIFNDTFGTGEYIEKEQKLNLFERINLIKCRNLLRKENWKEAFIIHNKIEYMKVILNGKSYFRKIVGK